MQLGPGTGSVTLGAKDVPGGVSQALSLKAWCSPEPGKAKPRAALPCPPRELPGLWEEPGVEPSPDRRCEGAGGPGEPPDSGPPVIPMACESTLPAPGSHFLKSEGLRHPAGLVLGGQGLALGSGVTYVTSVTYVRGHRAQFLGGQVSLWGLQGPS